MRYCTVNKLKPNMIVARHILDRNGRVYINQNVRLTPFMINRLKYEKYSGIFIFDHLSEDIFLKENVPLDLQIQTCQSIKENNIDRCIYLANEIASNLEHIESIYTSMWSISDYDSYTYMHSINVATYAGVLGIKLGFNLEKVSNLIMAGLLHDIGKTEIDENILNKPGKLTEEEYSLMKQHPVLGYNILSENTEIPSTVRCAVYQHHENTDGTGYPNGISGDDIYIFSRIIHICDVYDAMVSQRSYKKTINPNDVLEHLMAQADHMFDFEIVKVFINNIIPYPEGVLVKLSNGEIAVVKKNNSDVMRPIVITLKGKDIDLYKTLNVTIENIVI